MATKKKQYAVKAEAAVVHVNTVDERYLYRGATIPDTVSDEEVKRLVELDLVAELADVVIPGTEASVDPSAGV